MPARAREEAVVGVQRRGVLGGVGLSPFSSSFGLALALAAAAFVSSPPSSVPFFSAAVTVSSEGRQGLWCDRGIDENVSGRGCPSESDDEALEVSVSVAVFVVVEMLKLQPPQAPLLRRLQVLFIVIVVFAAGEVVERAARVPVAVAASLAVAAGGAEVEQPRRRRRGCKTRV